ncbi:hypothetical protein QBC43DRAFT_310464 [Cladorrhinum sp. PSN259]|nr:hypothetical protein QBC43DRAFT_310464 [Cladorrhinum sp. PSN259]
MPRQRSPSPHRRSRPTRNATTSYHTPRTRQFSPSPPTSYRQRYDAEPQFRGANYDYYNDHPLNNPDPDRGRTSHAQRPSLARSKSTSAKELLASGLKTAQQHMSPRWRKAAQAAVQAGGLAAFQARKQPGDWVGAKGVKVATAAFTAGLASSKMHKGEERRER